MFINDSDLKRVMSDYYKRHMEDMKSVAYYELLGAMEILKHAGLIGVEDYDQVINVDLMLGWRAACGKVGPIMAVAEKTVRRMNDGRT